MNQESTVGSSSFRTGWSWGRDWEDCSQQRVADSLTDGHGQEVFVNAALCDQDDRCQDYKRKRNKEDVEVSEEGDDANVQADGEEEGKGEEKSGGGKKTRLVAGDVAPHPERW